MCAKVKVKLMPFITPDGTSESEKLAGAAPAGPILVPLAQKFPAASIPTKRVILAGPRLT